ncbi:hypothetical protein [Actinophytocola oryzae]|uniref:hypothetical protein n=1 Tax=Actinophytocola oryzae TaxID=502181 RepID=UPI001063D458|nr:hypothetical protein [Actinophytocola oryzae]
MADPITDEHIAGVLRAFVRGCDPMLPRLREPDDVEVAEDDVEVDHGLLHRVRDRIAEVRWPGTAKWTRLSAEERSDWWVSRVGRLTSLAASVTGLAGALGDRLPLQDILGAAGQGLLLCAIAGEHGVDDRATRVRLLASVLFERDIDPAVAAGGGTEAEVTPAPETGRKLGVKPAAKWLWRQGRLLLAVQDELGKRPQGRFYHRALGMLPVVGMAGDYLGERSALKRAARAGDRWLHAQVPA